MCAAALIKTVVLDYPTGYCIWVSWHPSKWRAYYGIWALRAQAVVRFNFAAFKAYETNVGDKTDYWVAGHYPTKNLCCKGNNAGKITSKSAKGSKLLLWFPYAQEEIMQSCTKKYPENPAYGMQASVIQSMVNTTRLLRRDKIV